MRIYTSYFAKLKKIPDSVVPISICGKAPNGYTGIELKSLAPKYAFFMEWKDTHDNAYYIRHFQSEVLDILKPEDVYKKLETMSGGKDCVLVCYEKPADFCHRHLVANWLSKELNIEINEWE